MQDFGGTDLYTNAVSDIYYDNFDEGIFTGKGIYDVEIFHKVLCEEIPENTVLKILERVNMMTPELIHVNSFMFEPLIDMSIYHLIQLYKDCKEQLK